jgi:ribosomal-protein-alanine N-acetyltransferase
MLPPPFNERAFDSFPVLETTRLLLREVRESDKEAIFILRSDPRVRCYSGHPTFISNLEAEERIHMLQAGFASGEALHWCLESKAEERMIGDFAFWKILKQHRRAEIGYELLPDWWGKGIMTEAMKTLLGFGFESMKLHSVEANVTPGNKASVSLLLRNGFRLEGHFKENYYGTLPYPESPTESQTKAFRPQGFMDTSSFSLLESDFLNAAHAQKG